MSGQKTINIQAAYTEDQLNEKAESLHVISALSQASLRILKEKINKKGSAHFDAKIKRHKNLL